MKFELVKTFDPIAETLKKPTAVFPPIEKAKIALTAASPQIEFHIVHQPMMMETLQNAKDAITELSIAVLPALKISLEKMVAFW